MNRILDSDWWRRLLYERTAIFLAIPLVGNLTLFGLDWLAQPERFAALARWRIGIEVGLLAALALRSRPFGRRRPEWVVALGVLSLTLPLVFMTRLQGGFTGSYVWGISLTLVGAAVMVPMSWRRHAALQAVSVTAYLGVNAESVDVAAQFSAMVSNLFALSWFCVVAALGVFYQEQLLLRERTALNAVESLNRRLLAHDAEKDRFLANVSHELRTPLTVVLTTFRTLARRSDAAGFGRELVAGSRSAGRLALLINEMLDMTRFARDEAALDRRSTDLVALARDLVGYFQRARLRRVITLASPVDNLLAEVDAEQVRKVLLHLLMHAVKYTEPEAGDIRVELHDEGAEVRLRVRDNGLGLPDDRLQSVFLRFLRDRNSPGTGNGETARPPAGPAAHDGGDEDIGLGLALAQEIVRLHGGRIQLASAPGQGCTFDVLLPKGNPRAAPEGDPQVRDTLGEILPALLDPLAPEPGMESLADADDRPTVLVVEDEPDIRRYLEVILRDRFRVVVAEDGLAGLKIAVVARPCLIILDERMPRMNGTELTQRIREDVLLRRTPIVMLTAYADAETERRAHAAGVDAFLTKPFADHALHREIDRLLPREAV